MRELLKYSLNYYSQSGEDGILEEIFKRLNINKGIYVDVGSHNGVDISNTHYLREKDWVGLCIESDISRFKDLVKNTSKFKKTKCINESISETNLEHILEINNIPFDFDYLDIDIDSHDYYVWKNLNRYNPKIVQMEIIASVPLGVEQINDDNHWLTSFTSMLKLSHQKNYTLICYTGLNMIFVRNDLNYIISSEEKNNPNTNIYVPNNKIRDLRKLINLKSDIQKQLEKLIGER